MVSFQPTREKGVVQDVIQQIENAILREDLVEVAKLQNRKARSRPPARPSGKPCGFYLKEKDLCDRTLAQAMEDVG